MIIGLSVWGYNVMSTEIALEEKIIDFLKKYRDEDGKPKYIEAINALLALEKKVIEINFDDLITHDRDLAKMLSDEPEEFIDACKKAVYTILKIERPLDYQDIQPETINIIISGEEPGYPIKLRDISSRYLGKLITINGLLVKVSQLYTIPIRAIYKCSICGGEISVDRKTLLDRIDRPRCPEHRNARVQLVKDKTIFMDIQYARIQERPDELPPGQIPRFIDITITDAMIDRAYPGDIVKIVGILDIRQRRIRDQQDFDFILIVVNIESKEKEVEIRITKKEEEEFKRLAREEGFYDKLVRSIAPSIYGYKDIKEAILLSLIGGEDRELRDGTKIRGKIHLLLVGDPGVAKSQLLKYAAMIAPKGIYTSGRGSTAAGLTAAVIKESGGGMSLEAGAVVLADMGICSVDEIDKMRNEDRVALHEAMEQMTVSISKGGIVATLNARTTIIAAANPVDGIYNEYKTLKDNVNLPITLLSRFDLIRVMRDEISPDRDVKLTQHIYLSRESEEPFEDTFTSDFLRKFIAYARKLKVKITEEAFKTLQEYFIKLRAAASSSDEIQSIPITPRQFEALIRLTEASAKAHLREVATVEDAEIAIRQMNAYLMQVALDRATGTIDVTQISVGVPTRRASKPGTVLSILTEMSRERGGMVAEEDLINRIVKETQLKDVDEIRRIIDRLKSEGVIIEPSPGFYKPVRGL